MHLQQIVEDRDDVVALVGHDLRLQVRAGDGVQLARQDAARRLLADPGLGLQAELAEVVASVWSPVGATNDRTTDRRWAFPATRRPKPRPGTCRNVSSQRKAVRRCAAVLTFFSETSSRDASRGRPRPTARRSASRAGSSRWNRSRASRPRKSRMDGSSGGDSRTAPANTK